ncbi:acyltransferase [Trinickia dabaoshanensis]|uniref:Acyltransferase n=1 Tax=Trinickia dabaoshanensis TaxID=564714 RepID=A0A2N7VRR1_9BURK|nr:acyltransferase [Trinickia dabaoshanensis]PMS19823.1 acyltransferase [Trinickia dabaoshanensis]TAM50908.1 MAG: acyltransferase [Paraburkholderia sp.]
MRKTIVGLDAMRFVLAVYLMVFHTIHAYPQANDLPLIWLTDLGGFATSSFFILSGFILTHVYIERGGALRGGTRDFLVKRLSEIYPIHLIGLFLFTLVLLISTRSFDLFFLPSLGRGAQSAVQLSTTPGVFNWLLNILMLQVWDPRYSSINAPSWSLGCLLFFYLCFPILAPRLANMRRRAIALIAIWLLYLVPPLTVVLMGAYTPVAVGTIEHNPILRIPEFLGGILLYSLYASGHLKWMLGGRWRKPVAAAFVVLSFLLASRLIATGPLYLLYVLHNGALMPAELALVVLCADAHIPRWAHRTVSRLGNAALSIFGIHGALFAVAIKGLKLTDVNEPILRCAAHFSACAASAKAFEPSMASYPLYLIFTVIAAVLFQERCFVPIRTAIRRSLLRQDRRLVDRPGFAKV